ncbi:MAG TPA: hypothetical protein VH458_05760 [Vicinamibacterales bacterium]
MKSRSRSSSTAWMVTTFGWFSAEAARASCSSCRFDSLSPVAVADKTLIATVRFRTVSRAR